MSIGLQRSGVIAAVLSPSAVSSALSAEQTFTVPGLRQTDFVNVMKPTAQTGLGIVNCRVSADDTLAITFMNVNASTAVTPTASETYRIWWQRPTQDDTSVVGA